MWNMCQSLNNIKHQFYSCLNHLTKLDTALEHSHVQINQQARKGIVKTGVSHKVFNFHFCKGEDSAMFNEINQNIHILKENRLIQLDHLQEQYELINLTRVETAEDCKFLSKLDQELLKLNDSFFFLLLYQITPYC